MNDYKIFNDKLKEALEIYQEKQLSVLPLLEELENIYKFTSKFEIKMKKLINSQKMPYYRMINTVGKRAAIIFITIFISLLTTVLSVEALRKNVFNFFIEIYEKFSIIFVNKKDYKIEKVYVPTYLPDGFILTSKEDMGISIMHIYSDDKGNKIIFRQLLISTQLFIDTENRNTEEIDINGNLGLYLYDKECNNLIWDDGIYNYHLFSLIDKEELIKIAKSITLQK